MVYILARNPYISQNPPPPRDKIIHYLCKLEYPPMIIFYPLISYQFYLLQLFGGLHKLVPLIKQPVHCFRLSNAKGLCPVWLARGEL